MSAERGFQGPAGEPCRERKLVMQQGEPGLSQGRDKPTPTRDEQSLSEINNREKAVGRFRFVF